MTSSGDKGSRKALGRGLAALIPTGPGTAGAGALRELPIEKIRPNADQPRKQFDDAALAELAKSIELRGILQPIIVRRKADGYELVAGERRWRAAAKAGLQAVPAVVKDLTDTGSLEVALIENIQRQDLDPLEEASAYARLVREHGLTQDRVADAVGKSRAAVANSLRLLKLPESVLELLAQGELTAGHARAVMTLQPQEQARFATELVKQAATVREAERKARLLRHSSRKVKKPDAKTPAEFAVEERVQRALGTKVRLQQRKGKGRLEIHFHSLEHLDALLDRIAP